ncbi:hypothetical protein A2W14_05830 [Candidatus Gottesmanbacteria bacterium RBG_16_37_8]|uniref:Replication-associated protein ORF2/G2P domain-containing protein n=1 Tax=Candidatus Gottesmanbacteria bacterium RBG_16_37_8 TaxID=1798371 RepID=A0A1F5YV23_9BACT|nr:MAG: hypothetical protein A2W14_05830 [Candidatus Gottesmanbacteria bacterium RBG_16_37_8]
MLWEDITEMGSDFDLIKSGDNLSARDSETTLYLTNIRSIQQETSISKLKLKDKFFKTRVIPPKFCNTFRIAFIKFIDGKPKQVIFSRIPCNSWTCPKCQLNKALSVKYYLRDVIVLNNLSYFLTLTLDPSKIPDQFLSNSHRYITKLFNHFNTILRRKYEKKIKEKIKYVWVLEFQKSSIAHLHILYNHFLPIKLISALWVHVGGGHIMWIENVKTLIGVSNYISDYIVKGIKENNSESYFRFFQRRYSISKTCIRPISNKIKQLYKDLKTTEFTRAMVDANLVWVYNNLNSPNYKEKIVDIPAPKKTS